jgi:hypothetical protein
MMAVILDLDHAGLRCKPFIEMSRRRGRRAHHGNRKQQ